MRSRFKLLGAVFITGFAIAVFGATLVHALWYAPEPEVSLPAQALSIASATSSVAEASTTPSIPERLIIPSLNINANVQQVGLTRAGNMGVPNNFTDVAWYKYGPMPGQEGSAVIDGHVDNGLSLAGVFKHLSDLKLGDDVYVETANGENLHFKVAQIASYPYQSVPTRALYNMNTAPSLNLITCDGEWVAGGRTYDHRLVVFTKLVS